jgi:hemerythrin-like domain-containing protein
VDRRLELLTMHTYLENEVMYPEVRKALPDLEDDVLESYEEHHVADVLCRELLELDPTNEHFDAKTTVLIENVEHHMAEEEQEWFPKVRSGLGRKALLELGQRLEEVRLQAPTNPGDPRASPQSRHGLTVVLNEDRAAPRSSLALLNSTGYWTELATGLNWLLD